MSSLDIDIETLDAFFTNLLDVYRQDGDIVQEIQRFQEYLGIDKVPDDDDSRIMKAEEFSLEGAISTFKLQYDVSSKSQWKIEEIPETRGFNLSAGFGRLMDGYQRNFDRSSKAARAFGVNFILIECLTALKTGSTASNDQATDDSKRTHPLSQEYEAIKVYCEVSFSQSKAPGHRHMDALVHDRVDRVVGRIIRSSRPRPVHSLFLFVDAKIEGNLEKAFCELVVYLGSLHHTRLSLGRSDATVYGVVSDGYLFTFVTITHEGVVKRSRQFDVACSAAEMETVLGCMKYLLEKAASMDGGSDPAIDLDDDNKYLHPPDDEEDDEF